MGFSVEIDSVAVDVDDGATLSELALGRSTFTCSVTSHDGSVQPALWSVLSVTEGGSVVFEGLITSVSRAGSNGANQAAITTEITASDYSVYAEARVVKMTLPEGTVADRLALLADLLSDVGVSVSGSQATGETLEETPVDYESLASVLDREAELAGGWVWEINPDLEIRIYDPTAEAAAFNISIGDGRTFGDISVEPTGENYANRVYVRFSSAAQTAYAFLKTTGNFSDTETVTVGGRTYTFDASLADSDGHVQIGSDAEESLGNLVAAIMLGAGAGTAYAASMTENSNVTAYLRYADFMSVGARTAGASGNSIACTETAASAEWVHEGNVGTSTLLGGSDEALTNVAIAEDVSAQTALGHIRDLVIERPDLFSLAAAQAYADSVVAATVQIGDRLVYQTLRTDIHAGEAQTIVASLRGVNGSYVTTQVDAVENGEGEVVRTVSATLGTRAGSTWHDTVKGWGGGVSGSVVGLSLSGASTSVAASASPVWLATSPSEFVALEGTSTWRPATGRTGAEGGLRVYLDPATRGSSSATVFARLRTKSGTVKARLYNVTAGAPASGESDDVTSSTFSDVSFAATVSSAGWYELQVAGTSGALANSVGYVQ